MAVMKADLLHDTEINWGDELMSIGAIAFFIATILMMALEFFK